MCLCVMHEAEERAVVIGVRDDQCEQRTFALWSDAARPHTETLASDCPRKKTAKSDYTQIIEKSTSVLLQKFVGLAISVMSYLLIYSMKLGSN